MTRREWGLLGLVAGLGWMIPALSFDLRLPDEPRVAHTSFEMLRTGDFVVPTVNGRPFLQTPPLHYWILGTWIWLADNGRDGLARIPSVLLGLGTLLVVGRMASRRSSGRVAFLSVGTLASTMGFWDGGQRVVVDVSMTFFITLALWQVSEALADGDFTVRSGLLAGLATGCAFLSKGFSGPVIVASAAAIPLCLVRGIPRRALLNWCSGLVLGCCLVALPWTVLLWLRDPAYASELLFSHVSARFLHGTHKDASNFAFVHRSILKLLPWGLALPLAIACAVRAVRGNREVREGDRKWQAMLLSWFFLPLVLLLISRSKRNIYLLPVFPAFAMLLGLWLERLILRGHRERHVLALLWAGAVLLPIGGFAYQRWNTAESTLEPLGRHVAGLDRTGAVVVGYRLVEREEGALGWYLRHSFENVEDEVALLAVLRRAGSSAVAVGEERELAEALEKIGVANPETKVKFRQRLRGRILEACQVMLPD